MNGFGKGRVKRIYRGLGVGIIEREDDGEDVFFSSDVTKGGLGVFSDLGEGDRVRYREYPEEISGKRFAEDVWPIQ